MPETIVLDPTATALTTTRRLLGALFLTLALIGVAFAVLTVAYFALANRLEMARVEQNHTTAAVRRQAATIDSLVVELTEERAASQRIERILRLFSQAVDPDAAPAEREAARRELGDLAERDDVSLPPPEEPPPPRDQPPGPGGDPGPGDPPDDGGEPPAACAACRPAPADWPEPAPWPPSVLCRVHPSTCELLDT